MTNSYYSDEEVDYYHDRLTFYAEQVARHEITLKQVPRQLLLDCNFFEEVFFLVTGMTCGIDVYQKSAIVQSFLDGRKVDILPGHCHDVVSASNVDTVK